MTLYELASQYEEAAARIRSRIARLHTEAAQKKTDNEKSELEARIKALYPMYRESAETARRLRGYYH